MERRELERRELESGGLERRELNRRRFLTAAAGLTAAASLSPTGSVAAAERLAALLPNDGRALALPTADQLAWQDLEVGMFVHFAPNTWQGLEQDDLSTPLSQMDPKELNTDQWAETAVALGAKYIVFVAKHSGGFCMWQTATTRYSIGHTPWRGGKGDVLRDVSASCRKYGLKLGVYVSPRDTFYGADTGGRCKTAAAQARYNPIYRQQLTEVLSRYGSMVEVWFDGSNVIPVGDILARYAPHAMIFQGPHATIRWTGNEDGYVPYPNWNAVSRADAKTGIATALNGDPDGDVWLPNEVDVSILRPDWFWSTASQRHLLTLDQLLDVYYRSVGRGAQLLLNLPPDTRGLLPDADCARAREFGEEIRRRFGQSVAEGSGDAATLTVPLRGQQRIDTVVLEEDCSQGQRVRRYRLEARSGGAWRPLGTGTSIGHKRIQPVAPGPADAVRLTVLESTGRPAIRRFAVFHTDAPPPARWNAVDTAWAYDAAGEWKDHVFDLNLSGKITAATQYRLRFVPEGGWGGCMDRVDHATLLLDDVPQPKLVRTLRGAPDTLVLTLPAVGQKVVVQGRVRCAERGTILFGKY